MLSFAVNSDIVTEPPADWADLLKPEFANSVALAGDPRASNQAILGVYAAGLAAGGAAGGDAGKKGLDYFAEMNKAGNFVPVIGKSGTLAQGATPIIVWWDYNALSGRDALNGNPPVEVVVPKSGVVAGVYVQAISAFAPHPNAAKLWMEYLYSDEGQLKWLEGYCHPIRFGALVDAGTVPQELLDKLPPAASYEAAVFPTLEDQEAMAEVIKGGWDATVGANVPALRRRSVPRTDAAPRSFRAVRSRLSSPPRDSPSRNRRAPRNRECWDRCSRRGEAPHG